MTVRFDWRRFCTTNRVRFVTNGPNVTEGSNIAIKCPFCGNADPSEHMGLSLATNRPAWGCLRNSKHRGQHPAFLIQKLLGVRKDESYRMVEQETPPADDLEAAIAKLKGMDNRSHYSTSTTPLADVVPDRTFRWFRPGVGKYMDRFVDYLRNDRGFGVDAGRVALTYNLWWAITGHQSYRLIFPVIDHENDRLIGWTGRSIIKGAVQRYKAMSNLGKNFILTFDSITRKNIKHLVLCEGPMDALKMDYYGAPYGVAAVAMMGTAITRTQVAQLIRLQSDIKNIWVMFDGDAVAQALTLALQIEGFKGVVRFAPMKGYSDPGEMPPAAIKKFCEGLTSL